MKAENSPYNSPVRSSGLATPVARKLHEWFPNLTADELTALGLVGVAIGAAVGYLANRGKEINALLARVGAGITLKSSLIDTVDGGVASLEQKERLTKILMEKNPSLKPSDIEDYIITQLENQTLKEIIEKESPTQKKKRFFNLNGDIIDMGSDRAQETTLAFFRILTANARHDKVGQWLAYLTAITNILPSIGRAEAERHEIIVNEIGEGLDGLGARPGRAGASLLSMAAYGDEKAPWHSFLDLITTVSNMNLFIKRMLMTRKKKLEPKSGLEPEELSQEQIKEKGKVKTQTREMVKKAEKRELALIGLEAGVLVGMTGLMIYLVKRDNKNKAQKPK